MTDPTVIVLGGGIAGLYYAYRLIKSSPCCIEIWDKQASQTTTSLGRIRSVYAKCGRLEYEAGPWRINLCHEKMRELCHELDIHLAEAPQKQTKTNSSPLTDSKVKGPNFSRLDRYLASEPDLSSSLRKDIASGYMTSSYKPDITRTPCMRKGFLYPVQGFAHIHHKIKRTLQLHVRFCYDRLVLDVDPSGRWVRWRPTSSLEVRTRTLSERDRIVIACPPYFTRLWPLYAKAAILPSASVETVSLCRIFVKLTQTTASHDFHVVVPESRLQQISTTPGLRYLQISYSQGPIARHWHRIHVNDKTMLISELQREWKKLSPDYTRRFQIDWSVEPSVYFWEHGIHRFRAGYGFHLDRVVRACIYPIPSCIRILQIGEAYSGFQGWCEGALQTVDMAHSDTVVPRCILPRQSPCLSLGGWSVPIQEWIDRHPGGRQSLLNHIDDADCVHAMLRVGHSTNAFAIAFYLAVRYMYTKRIIYS